MDEELLKRNTDCVYFLASPFTCKKGADCDYRHSEMARLNPRDCWYWLSGSCLNPTCGFRHPPVDMHAKAPAEVEPLPNNSSFPPSKNNVPCYFYFNGCCNKGDKCPFLHGPEDILTSKQKDSAFVEAPPAVDRIPPDSSNHITPAKLLNAKLPARTEPVLAAPENFPTALKRTQKVANEDPFPWNRCRDISSILARKDSPQSYAHEYEEAFITKSDSLNQSDYVIKSEPSICSDQCLDEKGDSGVQDEWWESSPGFDVLVKGRSEGIQDADNQEYMLGYEDCCDHENCFIDHCYEDQKEYDGRFLREKRMHDEDFMDLVRYSEGERGANHILSQKRKLINVGLNVGGHCVDLREHLTNRRFLDDYMETHPERFAFRRCNVPLLSKERRARPQRRIPTQRLHGRLEQKMERKSFSFVAAKQRRQAWNNTQLNNRRLQHRHRRQKFSSNFQRTEFSRRKVDTEVSFTGPKTLGRVKAEKSRVKADSTGHSGQSYSVDFEGPKPLSEILKEKKVKSGGEGNNDGSSSA